MSLRALLFRRPPDPQLIEIAFDGEIYPVQLRRHAQARRYTLRVQAATRAIVLLTMPMRGSVREAKAFARAQWRLDRGAAQAAAAGDRVRRRARRCRCATCRTASRTGRARAAPSGSRPAMTCRCSASPARARISRAACATYLKREAKRELDAASRRYAAMLGVTVKRVAVRDQTSRWGSCTAAGVLSYSWRLILAPSHVLDYLAAHEVAHLVEMNHSRAFWRVVARICPDWERAKGWLNAHGTALHRYGGDGSANREPLEPGRIRTEDRRALSRAGLLRQRAHRHLHGAFGLGDDAQGLRVVFDAGEAQIA